MLALLLLSSSNRKEAAKMDGQMTPKEDFIRCDEREAIRNTALRNKQGVARLVPVSPLAVIRLSGTAGGQV